MHCSCHSLRRMLYRKEGPCLYCCSPSRPRRNRWSAPRLLNPGAGRLPGMKDPDLSLSQCSSLLHMRMPYPRISRNTQDRASSLQYPFRISCRAQFLHLSRQWPSRISFVRLSVWFWRLIQLPQPRSGCSYNTHYSSHLIVLQEISALTSYKNLGIWV